MNEHQQPLEWLEQSMDQQLQQMNLAYVRSVNKDLTRQNWSGTFGRNVDAVLADSLGSWSAQLHSNTLTREDRLRAREMISDFTRAFIQASLKHNRTTCALSNFAEEHHPDADYLNSVILSAEQRIESLFRAG